MRSVPGRKTMVKQMEERDSEQINFKLRAKQ